MVFYLNVTGLNRHYHQIIQCRGEYSKIEYDETNENVEDTFWGSNLKKIWELAHLEMACSC